MRKGKIFIVAFLLFIALFVLSINASAADTVIQEGDFFYEVVDGEAIIRRVGSSGKHIVIPETLGGYPVTEINMEIYAADIKSKAITLPKTLKKIGNINSEHHFEQLYVDSIETWLNITENNSMLYGLFFNTDLYVDGKVVTDVVIPDSKTKINTYAFHGLKINSVTFSESIQSVSTHAFDGSFLKKVYVPDLETWFRISNVCTYTDPEIYINNEKPVDIVIPENIDTIPGYAFEDFYLKSITFTTPIKEFGYYWLSPHYMVDAFYVDSFETWMSFEHKNAPLQYAKCLYIGGEAVSGDYVFPEACTRITNNAFANYKALKNITLHSGIEHIGDYAFSGTDIENVYVDSLETWLKICDNIYTSNGRATSVANPMYYAENLYVAGELLVDLVIPESVTKIPAYGLFNIKSIESVTLHSGIEHIGVYAFSGTGIENVCVDSLETWLTICDNIYTTNGQTAAVANPMYYAENLYVAGELLVDLVIPENITEIPKLAFYNVKTMKSLTLHSNVQKIGKGAFSDCTNIESVYVPDIYVWLRLGGLKNEKLYIAGELLTDYTFPEGVTAIPDSAFGYCKSLKSITFPSSLESIGNNAFVGCVNLKSVTIRSSLQNIGKDAFKNCTNIESVYASSLEDWLSIDFVSVDSNPLGTDSSLYINGKLLENLRVPESIGKIKQYAFYGYSKLNRFEITGSSLIIGYNAFSTNCKNMEIHAETLEDWFSVKVDPDAHFDNYCNPMRCDATLYIGGKQPEEIVIPEEVESIPSYAFQNCYSLKKITIPATTKIGYRAFSDSGLREVIIGSLTEKIEPVKIIAGNPFDNCVKLEKITLGYGVKSIQSEAFYKFSNLKEVVFYSGIEEIGKRAFYDTSIRSVTIPSTVKRIGENAFAYCDYLADVTFGDVVGVKSDMVIEDYAFWKCAKLTNVTFNSGVKKIGESVFYKSNQIENVYINDLASYVEMELPYYEKSNYSNPMCFAKNMYVNGELVKNLVIPEGVKRICNYAFFGCKSLETVKFPSTLTEVEYSAFQGCSNLKDLSLPESVEKIHEYAFFSCLSITSVELKNNLTEVGLSAFEYCKGLKTVYMYPELLDIAEGAFLGCENIELVLYAGTEEAWNSFLKQNKKTGLEGVAVFYSFRPELMYAPKEIKAEQTADSITLTWSKINGVTGYRVYVKNGSDWKTVKTLNKNTYKVTGLKSGTKYTFAVKAYISTGAFVLWSPEYITIDTVTRVGKPSKITASCTATSITLKWNKVTGASGYRVYKYNPKTKKYEKLNDVTSNSFKISKLKSATTYKFKVRAYSKFGGTLWGSYSDVFETYTKFITPNVTSATQSTNAVDIKWKKVTGASGYTVYRYASGEWKRVATIKSGSTVSYKVQNLKSGKTYKFRVKAYKTSNGKTFWSDATPTITVTTKPLAPSITKLTTTKGKVSFTWSDVSRESGYQVYYSTKKSSGYKKVSSYKANVVKGSKSKLTRKKTYYFKVRAYKKTASGTVYSSWSSVKSIKVK